MPHPVESEIPVPWGKIAVKAWGDKSSIPVLVIHGIQDNCGSFDHLIPHLSEGFYFYCIDLPGHGKSSPFPPGMPLDFLNYVYSVKLVVEHLEWKTLSLMAHSLGAQISLFFTAIFPERVEKLILIDGLSPLFMQEERSIPHLRNLFNSIYEQHKKLSTKNPPSYSYEEALKRSIENRDSLLTDEAARTLLKRSLVPSGRGYRFLTDQRLKLRLRPILTMKQMKHFIVNIKCPALMLIAKDTFDLIDKVSAEAYHERLKQLFYVMPNFSFVIVPGNHDVHLNYPQRVAPYVNSFLLKPNSSSL